MIHLKNWPRFANSTTQYDSLAYSYYANSAPYSSQNKNHLKQITDTQSSGSYSYDIDSQPSNNYAYDASGQLIKDSSESITKIMWTAYGKVDSIVKSNNQRIKYEYDAMDHRIMKKINYAGGSLDTMTYYIYDAQGNVLSTYQKVKQTSGGSYAHVKLQDINLYGSERLGNMKVDSFMYATARLGSAGVARNYSMGKKRYELTDHLGNVYSTISDRRLGSGTAGQVVTVWNPDVLTAQDYLPYGMPIYDKLYKATSTSYYKYAFNGKEKDDETKGAYNSYDYGYRMYDPRVCRFLSIDPITRKYPELTPYQFASNTPIQAIDLDGLEAYLTTGSTRATVLFVTVAINASLVAAPNGLSLFVTPEVGVAGGVSLSAGVSGGYYPNVNNSEQLGGWGSNIGGSFMGNGGDLSASFQQDNNGNVNDYKLGGSGSVPGLGGGAGAEGHLSATYSFLIGTVEWKDIKSKLPEWSKKTGMSEEYLNQLADKVKKGYDENVNKTNPKQKNEMEKQNNNCDNSCDNIPTNKQSNNGTENKTEKKKP
ncbi:MAG: hypothetical protein IPL31_10590 [Saprospiraceae bacterium]|nr:hypothetical protein [Saprospiraceae bacterium]